jgi:DNA-binding MarR family transcriptional regulator
MSDPLIRVEPGFEDAWPGASRLATECILNIGALYDQFDAWGRALVQAHGVPSIAAFNVLTVLHGAREPLPPSTIAARMIVSRPTMTGILGTLARHGLIRRLPHAGDRRMALIEITAEGRACVDRLLPQIHAAEKAWVAGLSEQEQETLLEMVARLQGSEVVSH